MTSKTRRLFGHAWSVICWIVLSGLTAAGVAALYYYHRADDELRLFVESKLQESYPHLTVRLGAAHIVQGEGVRLDQISFAHPSGNSAAPRAELAYADAITIDCTTNLAELAQGHFEVRHVRAIGLHLYPTRDTTGRWSLESLVPRQLPPCRGTKLPTIEVERAKLLIRDERDAAGRMLQLDDLNLRVRFKRLSKPQPGQLPELLITFDAATRAPMCRAISLEGVARTTDGAWTVRGNLDGANWSPDVLRQLPDWLAERAARAEPLHGTVAAAFQVSSKSRQHGIEYSIDGHLIDGTWQDPQWPQVVSDIQCDFLVDTKHIDVPKLTAQIGSATLAAQLKIAGHSLSDPFHANARFGHFPVTPELIRKLPPAARDAWEKLQAVGRLSGDLEVDFDGNDLAYSAELACHDFALRHYKFPYPVTNCNGTVTIVAEDLNFHLQGLAGKTPVKLHGQLHRPGPNFTGWWEVKTLGLKPIDDPLIAALPPRVSDFVESLQPRGNIGCWMRYERQDPTQRPQPQIVMAIENGWINYEQFPYPLNNVSGRIESVDGHWKFMDLVGENDSALVRCHGTWNTLDPVSPLELFFEADHLSLDTELRHALPPGAQEAWRQLRPQGQLNQVAVRFFKTKDLSRPQIDVDVDHRESTARRELSESLQLNPVAFPLRLSNARLEAHYRNDAVRVRGFTCEHGPIRIRSNGTFDLLPTGGWQMNLTDFSADNLDLRQSVLDALPPRLARSLRQLQVNGTFALGGAFHVGQPAKDEELSSSWLLRLDAEHASLNCGLPVENIFGQVSLDGGSQGNRYWNHGDMQLDSLMCQRVQVTQVTGPCWVDNQRALFGQRVPARHGKGASAPIVGTVYQGKISAQAEVLLDRDTSFSIQSNVTNADLSLLARDWKLGQGSLSGQAMLELFLSGNAHGRQSLKGNGTSQLRNANLYELPLILALWGRLSSNRPTASTITNSDMAFTVRDGYVYFDRFDLSGDAITLKGIGEMGLNREINLDFYTIMGREQLWSPLVRPFLGEASRQFLQIHVDGTLSDPRTTPEVLPGINETLQRLFPEMTTENRQAARGAAWRGR
ncbi:MAG: hypothetical protein KDA92_01740 [Planctomycetales bacterium]|nr:hypothetical protein [Planctomycetales bacterium]